MMFVKPEVEIRKFSVEDVLTASTASESNPEPSTISREGAAMEGECRGTAWDNTLEDDCI